MIWHKPCDYFCVILTHLSLQFRVHTRVFVTLFVAILVTTTIWSGHTAAHPQSRITATVPGVTLRAVDHEKESENEPPPFSIPFTLPFFFFR